MKFDFTFIINRSSVHAQFPSYPFVPKSKHEMILFLCFEEPELSEAGSHHTNIGKIQ
jgi:hypothetical protein